LGAPERRRLRSRRRREAEPDAPPPPVTTGRATIVEAAAPLAGEEAARDHLRRAGEGDAEAAVRTLNRLLGAQRLAVHDPYLHDVGLEQAIAVRVGYATGQGGAEGRLAEAVELPVADTGPQRVRRRASALRPQEHLAAIVGGHTRALAAEELALRARADVEAGRTVAAALEVRSALEAAVAELAGEDLGGDLPARVQELQELLPAAREAAAGALGADPPPAADPAPAADPPPADPTPPPDVETILGRLEAALRARSMHLP
jgi:hypothetical protein